MRIHFAIPWGVRRTLLLLAAGGCGFTPGNLAGDTRIDGAIDVGVDAVPPPRCTLHLGSDHSCSVRTSDGALHCVGSNTNGELGRDNLGGFSTMIMPVGVGATISASSRSYHACVAASDRTVSCWGANDSGQLGDGTYTPRGSPPVFQHDLENACRLTGFKRLESWGSYGGEPFDVNTSPDLLLAAWK
jgi:hypothetical protein